MAGLNAIALCLLKALSSAGRGGPLFVSDLRGAQGAQTLLLVVAETVKIGWSL